jgi:predicted phosphoribosyltransferase
MAGLAHPSTARAPYGDRVEAGDELAENLRAYADRSDVVVLALPRGGVPVAARIAARLDAPLDVLTVRKLGLPSQPELAMGAIAAIGGHLHVVRNDDVLAQVAPPAVRFDEVRDREVARLRAAQSSRRGSRVAIEDRVVIVVDDGLATGSTMRAAVAALRRVHPLRIVVAVPIGAPQSCAALSEEVDELVCPWRPEGFMSVGRGYRDFRPVDDAEVARLLHQRAD